MQKSHHGRALSCISVLWSDNPIVPWSRMRIAEGEMNKGTRRVCVSEEGKQEGVAPGRGYKEEG